MFYVLPQRRCSDARLHVRQSEDQHTDEQRLVKCHNNTRSGKSETHPVSLTRTNYLIRRSEDEFKRKRDISDVKLDFAKHEISFLPFHVWTYVSEKTRKTSFFKCKRQIQRERHFLLTHFV